MEKHQGRRVGSTYIIQPLETPRLEVTGETLMGTGNALFDSRGRDSDHENIANVLTRLQNYQQNRSLLPVCVTCECRNEPVVEQQSQKNEMSDADSSDIDDESDDEDLTVDHMIQLLQRYQERAACVSNVRTMVRLISSYHESEELTEEQVTKIQILLRKARPELREAGLLFIRQLCILEENAVLMSSQEVFNDLLTVLSSPHHVRVQVAALKAAEQLFSHASVAASLWEAVDEVLLPVLLRILYSDHPAEMKYTSCCVLRTLSRHPQTAGLVGQELLFIIKELKNSNSKIKEVFVEIVINLYQQTDVIYPDMIDKNILHSTTAMIRDGPCCVQRQALHLVVCLAQDDCEIEAVIRGKDLILCILQCLRDSQCKKVREAAGHVIGTLTAIKKSAFAKSLMDHFAYFLNPEIDQTAGDISARGSPTVVYPVRVKHQAEMRMWRSFDKIMSVIARLITREATIDEDRSTGHLTMDDQPLTQWNAHQLGSLANLVTIATNFCMWPVERNKYPVQKPDLSDLTDDENLRNRFSRLNRQVTLEIWNKCGRQAAIILGKFGEKLHIRSQPLSARSRPGSPSSAQRNKSARSDILIEQEIQLITSLLDFFLCIAIATCNNKRSQKLKENDGSNKPFEKEAGPKQKVEKLWVQDNPYLTPSIDRYMMNDHLQPDFKEKKQQDFTEKEASTDRRLLRKGLYEEDLFRIVSPFVDFDHQNIRVVSTLILRCAIQPLEEKLAVADLHVASGHTSGHLAAFRYRMRPTSARSHKDQEKKMSVALHRMSPELAGIIRDAVGPRPCTVGGSQTGSKVSSKKPKELSEVVRPILDLSQPIAHQCRQLTVQNCGAQLLKGIFSKNRDVRKSCLLLIHDLVNHGNVETHMQLSELGCIPRLIDFLRINEDDEMLEIIGLILTRMLVLSDNRLKQLFNRYGGTNLLLAMAQYTSGVVKEEVRTTLKAVTQGSSPQRVRPSSAPSRRPSKQPDIWDHIMRRWHYEDNVVRVLQKWI